MPNAGPPARRGLLPHLRPQADIHGPVANDGSGPPADEQRTGQVRPVCLELREYALERLNLWAKMTWVAVVGISLRDRMRTRRLVRHRRS